MSIVCSTCDYAVVHGWWGSEFGSGTHCRVCHRSWAGRREAHCTVCHQHFSADSVADKHEPYCTPDPTECAEKLQHAEMRDGNPVFNLRERPGGPIWIGWSPEPHPQAVARG